MSNYQDDSDDFDKRRKEFDRDFNRARRLTIIGGYITIGLVLGTVIFAAWVIIMLMQFFEII